MIKGDRSEEASRPRKADDTTTSPSPDYLLRAAPAKISRVLVYLRHFGSLNRFEAARKVGDTCLNSSIPALEGRHGLTFERQPEKSPNRWGEPTDCMRYSLPASEYERADRVIAHLFRRRAKAQKVLA